MKEQTNRLTTILSVVLTIVLLTMTQVAQAGGNGKGKGKNKNIGVGNASDGVKARIVTDSSIVYTGDPLSISLHFPRGAELVADGDVDAYVVIFAPNTTEDEDPEPEESGEEEGSGEESGTDDGSGDDSESDDGSDDTESDDGSDDTESDDGSDDSESDDGSDDSESDDGESAGATEEGEGDEPLTDAIVVPVSDLASSEETKLFEVEAVDLSTIPAGTYQLGLILTNPDGDPLNLNDWYNGLLGLVAVKGLTITDEAVEFDSDGDGEVDDDKDGDGFSDDDDDEEEEESEEEESEDDEDDSDSTGS